MSFILFLKNAIAIISKFYRAAYRAVYDAMKLTF